MPESEEVFRSFLRAYGSLRQVMEPYFAQFGISGPQWAILRNLRRAETEGQKGLRLCDLGARLLIRPPSVTGAVDRLERRGLVSRTVSASDRRVRRIRLTPAGRVMLNRVLAVHSKQVKTVMDGLSLAEQATLRRLLDQLGGHLRAMARERGGTGHSLSSHSLD